jgi:hypothetical protein
VARPSGARRHVSSGEPHISGRRLLPTGTLAIQSFKASHEGKSNAGAKALCLLQMAELIDLLWDIQASTHLQQNWKVDLLGGVEVSNLTSTVQLQFCAII